MSLRIEHLSVDIARRRIVTDISLAARAGQFTGLLGPNGSGKSTILKTIYRVHRPAAGRILLDGADLLALPAREAARRIAVVSQESTSEFDFTVREMVMIGRTPHQRGLRADTEADHAAVEQAIERVGCGHVAHRSFNTLSGGEKQLVLVARALAQGADHLILDEPTNHLDIRHQVEILEVVAGLGVTVLAALHDLSLAALFCQSAYLLCGGQVILGGPPASVLTVPNIRRAYGAEVLVIPHPDTGQPHLIPRRTTPDGSAPAHRDPEIRDPGIPDIPDIPDIPARPEGNLMHLHRSSRPAARRPVRAVAAVAALLAATGLLAACGSEPAASPPAAPAAHYPVTVTSCGVPVTYQSEPKRAVSNDINTTEDMLALGLESHMAGTFGAVGDGPVDAPAIPAAYQAGFKKVRDVSPDDYFTLEELVALHPDFLFAGWNYGLQVGTNLTPAYLSRFGIKTLVLTESCAHVQSATGSVSIDDTYQDLRNLGEIFNVRARAQKVIAGMQAQVAAARAKIAGLKPVKVFDYDSGEAAPVTGPGLSMPTALISLGGGTNIFASLKQSWTSVSWEQVVAAQPQCIIINDYSTPTVAQKEKFLETFSASKNLPAVKNRCFLPLSYDEVTPSPRNAQAVVAIARWLHPAAFGLPPDGS